MIKVLFSPSETKKEGGSFPPISQNSFIFPELFSKREEIFQVYQEKIDTLEDTGLEKLFGVKGDKILPFKKDILKENTQKAILRYTGVAYDYLNYPNLTAEQQSYIDKNVVIFSNIFGPILGEDHVPNYKFKQGGKIENLKIENHYLENFSQSLDEFLQGSEVIDLRAGFYEKFYKISKPYLTMKFIKGGKVVSHWAKAYRGIILRELAKNSVATKQELLNLQIENLSVFEIREIKNKTEIIYNIQ